MSDDNYVDVEITYDCCGRRFKVWLEPEWRERSLADQANEAISFSDNHHEELCDEGQR